MIEVVQELVVLTVGIWGESLITQVIIKFFIITVAIVVGILESMFELFSLISSRTVDSSGLCVEE